MSGKNHRKLDLGIHLAIVGLLLTILLSLISLAYYFGNRDEKIGTNASDIQEIKTVVKGNKQRLDEIYYTIKAEVTRHAEESNRHNFEDLGHPKGQEVLDGSPVSFGDSGIAHWSKRRRSSK